MATGQARGVKALHKIDWLVLDNEGRVLAEVQQRKGDVALYRSALIESANDPRPYGGPINQAIGSGTDNLTNFGRGLPPGEPDATGARARLRSYLFFSHGPDFRAETDKAHAIVPVPAGYKPGSFHLLELAA